MSLRFVLPLAALAASILPSFVNAGNSSYSNPMLPGFFPDPSCIFVPELDNTFFCVTSTFSAFPGLPIHASKDLANWKHVSNVLNRPDQLPTLAITNRSTSGIWGPALRYHEGVFYVMTTLVHDEAAPANNSRWDNILFQAEDPFSSASWSDPLHFEYIGYDPEPFWAEDGTVYLTGSHPWRVAPGLTQTTINLTTGEVGPDLKFIWNGTGGLAPEGPGIYRKDGWYYLSVAEGGTGINHMQTIARSKDIGGPYTPNPANPILSNANTSEYFQTVGNADFFQDETGNWWGVALATRSGPNYTTYPMGRESVLFPVTWSEGDWPILAPVRGEMQGWQFPPANLSIGGEGVWATASDDLTFPPGSTLPIHLVHWRLPIDGSYTISPPDYPNTLRLSPSKLNLTGYDGNYAGPDGQTFVGRRQTDTLFTYSVEMEFDPQQEGDEAGISVFLTQNHHIDLGIVLLPNDTSDASDAPLVPYFRFSSTTYLTVPPPVLTPLHSSFPNYTTLSEATTPGPLKLYLEIKAADLNQYTFSAGPVNARSQAITVGRARAADVSFAFTGTLLGVYATTNGRAVNSTSPGAPGYISNWKYTPQGQFLD